MVSTRLQLPRCRSKIENGLLSPQRLNTIIAIKQKLLELNSNMYKENNMNTAKLIYEKSKQLPEPVASQVLDFINYLEQKETQNKQTSLQNTNVMAHLQTSTKKNHRLGELLAK